jgi:hypothetical protein
LFESRGHRADQPPGLDWLLQARGILVSFIYKHGPAFQDVTGVLQCDGDRYVEQSVARRDDGRLRLVGVAICLVETNALITFTDRDDATGKAIPVAETPRHAGYLITSALTSSDLAAKPHECLLEESTDVVWL